MKVWLLITMPMSVMATCRLCPPGQVPQEPDIPLLVPSLEYQVLTCQELSEMDLEFQTCFEIERGFGQVCDCDFPQQEAQYPPCLICEPGEVVTFPDLAFVVLTIGFDPVTCQEIFDDGINGKLTPNNCLDVRRGVHRHCGCELPQQNLQCPLCGPNEELANPTQTVLIPGPNMALVSCEDLQDMGNRGEITPQDCLQIQQSLPDTCGCQRRRHLRV